MNPKNRSPIPFLLLLVFIWLGAKFLLPLTLPFLVGGALALTAEPLTGLLCRLRFPRPLAAFLGVGLSCLGIGLLGLMLCAFLLRELGILAGVLPGLADTAAEGIGLLRDWLLDLSRRTPGSIRPVLEQNVTGLFSGSTALLNKGLQYMLGLAGNLLKYLPDSALGLGTAVISGYMISVRLPKIRHWLLAWLPGEKLRPLLDSLKGIRNAVGGWLSAQLRLAGTTLILLTLGLLLLRIPYGPLWALGITLVDAFPILGTGAVLIPWAFVCWLRQDGARALGLLGLFATVSLVRSILEPKLVGKKLGLDPLATLAALYAGYKLWGLAGMLFAPLLTVAALQFLPRKSREIS